MRQQTTDDRRLSAVRQNDRRRNRHRRHFDEQRERARRRPVGLYTFFSPSTIYILFPYSFRILVPNRVYILEYAKNTAPNRAYILKYSLYSR